MCCNPWDRKELDTTERLNRTELNGELSFNEDRISVWKKESILEIMHIL